MNMPLSPSWQEISVRLALTLIAGAIIGFNRGARGLAAGFRTTILVGLAASVAMIQTNILLPLAGKTPESFAVMDLMRLPLGILTGVGFIGGGAIFKKGDLVTGVTTAATLWMVTVIGLCLGGGQLGLGVAATALTVITLWILKWVDLSIPREHRAVMVVTADNGWSPMSDLPTLIAPLKCRARFRKRSPCPDPAKAEFCFEVSWRLPEQSTPPPNLLQRVSEHYPVISFELTSENGR
jgi:putative Mg2+ transporter-C (MgtC) family protein